MVRGGEPPLRAGGAGGVRNDDPAAGRAGLPAEQASPLDTRGVPGQRPGERQPGGFHRKLRGLFSE